MTERDEELLVDFLEDELDPALKRDLDILLSHSEERRKSLGQFKTIRRAIQSTSSEKVPDSPEYFDRLHDKIMEGIGTKRPTPVIWLRFAQPRFAAGMAAGLVAVFTGWSLLNSSLTTHSGENVADTRVVETEDLLVETSAGNPAEFVGSTIAVGDETDLIMDLAARRMEGMSDSEMKEFISDLME